MVYVVGLFLVIVVLAVPALRIAFFWLVGLVIFVGVGVYLWVEQADTQRRATRAPSRLEQPNKNDQTRPLECEIGSTEPCRRRVMTVPVRPAPIYDNEETFR